MEQNYRRTRICLLLIMVFSAFDGSAQDFSWWNKAQNWDGITPWHQYITTASNHMGPNSLPVPQIKKGLISNDTEIEYGIFSHLSNGDNTQNFMLKLYLPLAKDKAALEIYGVPVEYFKMDFQTRDDRGCRDYDGEGFAGGDIYFGTILQLVGKKEHFPDVTLSLNCKTASGNNFRNARFTDTPGYFFDLSFGKTFSKQEKGINNSTRLYGTVGFYGYQTYSESHRQDDAVMYGTGITIRKGSFSLDNAFGGYYGYIGNGDRPFVYRFSFTKIGKQMNLRISYQLGIIDLDYHSIGFTMISHFSKK